MQVCRGAYIPYFKINDPIFCFPLFCEVYLNSQVTINNLVNEHTVDYNPNSLKLASRMQALTWAPKRFISTEHFLTFFSNLYIPPWLWKSFKFKVLGLLTDIFVSQKIEFKNLSPRILLLSPRPKEIIYSS